MINVPNKLKVFLSSLRNTNRLIVLGIKYIPVACTILLTLHTLLLILGCNEPITVTLSVALLVLLLVLLSFRFHFCKFHKAMIIYMAVMTLCICLQKYGAFGNILLVARVLMLCVGLVLVVYGVIKIKGDDCCK